MNGSLNGHGNMTSEPHQHNGSAANGFISRIENALEVVHGPYSTNESRKQASIFLEELKADDEAPYHGYSLAVDKSQSPVVRHYALSLLEHAVRHKWTAYSPEQADTLRRWVVQLSQELIPEDPLYLRNKTSQLWVEIAKRCWAGEWRDMDQLLVQMWERADGQVIHKEFVLFVLETLSEEVFNGEDIVAALREGILSRACVEILTPAAVLAESFPNRQTGIDGGGTGVRCGEAGWLARLGELLDYCLANDVAGNEQYRSCAIRTLAVYRSVMPWAIPRAIAAASCVEHMCKSLASPSVPVQMASVEALHSLYSRSQFSDEEFLALVCPMYTSQIVDLLRRLFEWSIVEPDDIDDEKYLFSKKFSEMMSNLGNFIDQNVTAIPDSCDLPNLFSLFLAIVRSKSLVISIPLLVTWSRLLRSPTIGGSPAMFPIFEPLLDNCIARLIRYDELPEDSHDPSLEFLLEDIDTIPERHAFIGNYRRYSNLVIELSVRQKRGDALYHVLSRVDRSMQQLYDNRPPFDHANFVAVESALKGFIKWRSMQSSKTHNDEEPKQQERATIEQNLEAWNLKLLDTNFEDPSIRQRILQLSVAMSTTALDKKAGFMMKVLESILMTQPVERPDCQAYSDAIRDLQNSSSHELQRLAIKMPDYLLTIFDQLEAKIKEIAAEGKLDMKQQASYQTFLFIIIHRAKGVDASLRLARLEEYIQPITQMWRTPELERSLSSFDGFCEMLGLHKVRQYLISRRVHNVEDWSAIPLDAEGQSIQSDLTELLKVTPLRPTRSFLGACIEKIENGSIEHRISCRVWHDPMPIILPKLLQLLSHAHAFHNPTNWLGLPEEMRSIVSQILTDRFWQSGISEGSKDQFYARVTETRLTMEGFASSIRGSVRAVRETCYSILYSMSRLDFDFYGFGELPGPLAHALFADALCLSSHQMNNLLNLVKHLVDDCPTELRAHFLPPILATCFAQLDAKTSAEWEGLGRKQQASAEGDDLTSEMREESVLRQLTYAGVSFVVGLLDPARPNPPAASNPETDVHALPSMREFIISSPSVIEPILLFATHAIRMRDSRCCSIILRVFRSLIPDFGSSSGNSSSGNSNGNGSSRHNNHDDNSDNHIDDSNHRPAATSNVSTDNPSTTKSSSSSSPRPPSPASPIREFLASEVLMACISSLHEPYFVELQRELAQTIALILVTLGGATPTPRRVLASLPGVGEPAVDALLRHLNGGGTGRGGGGSVGGGSALAVVSPRQQAALVLELLRDLKGVSVHEQGRIRADGGGGAGIGGGAGEKAAKMTGTRKKPEMQQQQQSGGRSKMQMEFMRVQPGQGEHQRGTSPELDGVAGMFEGGS